MKRSFQRKHTHPASSLEKPAKRASKLPHTFSPWGAVGGWVGAVRLLSVRFTDDALIVRRFSEKRTKYLSEDPWVTRTHYNPNESVSNSD